MKISTEYQSTPALWMAYVDVGCGCEDCFAKTPHAYGKTERAAIDELMNEMIEEACAK